jgi:hypothetical protein
LERLLPSFTPPTHEEPIRTTVRPLNYFRLTWAASVVRVNGTFTTVRSPSQTLLQAAGESGVDYFLGGHTYDISDETATELVAAGFDVDGVVSGYGVGPYGLGAFGL